MNEGSVSTAVSDLVSEWVSVRCAVHHEWVRDGRLWWCMKKTSFFFSSLSLSLGPPPPFHNILYIEPGPPAKWQNYLLKRGSPLHYFVVRLTYSTRTPPSSSLYLLFHPVRPLSHHFHRSVFHSHSHFCTSTPPHCLYLGMMRKAVSRLLLQRRLAVHHCASVRASSSFSNLLHVRSRVLT